MYKNVNYIIFYLSIMQIEHTSAYGQRPSKYGYKAVMRVVSARHSTQFFASCRSPLSDSRPFLLPEARK
jgi:hypothetical protein